MSKEQVKEEQNPFIQPSIEEMLENSEVVYDESEEPKVEDPTEEAVEGKTETETEEKTETETKEKVEEEVEEKGLTEERFAELAAQYPELVEHKKFKDDYGNWEKKLRQKSQAVAYLKKLQDESPDKIELLVNKLAPYMYGQEELPKAPSELVDEVMQSVEIDDLKYTDDDEFEVKVGKDKIEPVVKRAVEKALNSAVPEMAALRSKVAELSKGKEEVEQNYQASMARQGELEMEQLAGKHKMLDFNRLDGETILEAVARIQDIPDHPEQGKLSKWNAIGSEANRKKCSLEKAFKDLYGDAEIKANEEELTTETIAKNQKTTTQEIPGGEQDKIKEEWEQAGVGDSHEARVDALFKKQGL